jgi:hypothetical protein
MPLLDQSLREMAADESGAAGDENLETFQCRSLLDDDSGGA